MVRRSRAEQEDREGRVIALIVGLIMLPVIVVAAPFVVAARALAAFGRVLARPFR